MAVYTSPIADAFGGFLIGVFISLVMYGVIISQCVTYYERYHKDPLWIKCYVAVILLLDTASSWFAVQWMYVLFVLNWGNIEPFTYGGWLLALDPILAGLIAFLVQMLFAWRIKIITYSPWYCAPVIFFAILNLLGAIGTAIALVWVKSYAKFNDFQPIATIWLASSAIADIIITAVLSWHLRSRRTGIASTTLVLHRIVRLTIQNGLLTSLTAIADLVLYLSFDKPYHITLSFIIPKLYCNTILSSLNAREVGKEKEWTTDPDFVDLVIVSKNDPRKNRVIPALDSHLDDEHTETEASARQSVQVDIESQIPNLAKSKNPDDSNDCTTKRNTALAPSFVDEV